jgi:hypothetical protein
MLLPVRIIRSMTRWLRPIADRRSVLILEAVIQVNADALQSMELAGKARTRQSVVRSCRRNGGFDQREIRRDPHGPYDPAGITVVASVWLAFYVANVIHLL